MRRILLIVALVLVALVAWAGLVLGDTLYGWTRAPIAPRGDTRAFAEAAIAKIDAESHGNAAFALIDNGRVVAVHDRSTGTSVDSDTLFQVASLSKWITAWGVLTLVDSGRIDLDAPVSRYLTRWHLPPSSFDNDGVTVRRLLSHTAGLTDGLGYAGFEPGKPIQTLEQSLTRAADASPGADGAVRVGAEPGGAWDYSGGGYTLLQLLIEEVSGEPFNAYMQRAVLQPLGMTRSTFELPPDATNVAEIFDTDGSRAIHYQFTAKAAASLYTSTTDLALFIQAHLPGPNGEPPGRGVLRPETMAEMRKPLGYQYGAEVWGMGVVLYAPNNSGDYIVGHDGSNDPAINTAARFDPVTGDGIVVLETGDEFLATQVAGDWVFWNTGNVDVLTISAEMRQRLTILLIGWGGILVAAVLTAWLTRRRGVASSASA